MKPLKEYKTAIDFIKDLPLYMIWGSMSLKKRWIIDRKIADIDIVVPSYFWWEFLELGYKDDFETNKYWNIVPDWIFIYSHIFNDWSIDLIFRKDFQDLRYDIINWYKHLDVEEILRQKKHLLSHWNGAGLSKHKNDIKNIENYLNNKQK